MNRLIVMGILSVVPAAMAAEPYELQIPSLEEQYDSVQRELLDEAADALQTDPYMGGQLYTLYLRGNVYRVVDRTKEPAKPSGTAGTSRMSSFINGLSAEARAQLRIIVKFNADGSETWDVAFNATWQAETGMGDAFGKSHK